MRSASFTRQIFPTRQACHGFTLVELVIVIVLLAILGTVGVSMLYEPYSTARIVNATNTDATKARYALERVARELREAQWGTTASPPGFCFTIASNPASSFTFHNTKNSSSTACDSGNQVAITIVKTSTDPDPVRYDLRLNDQPIANNVASFNLAFKNSSNADTSSSDLVRSIEITLTVADPSGGTSTSSNASEQRTRVYLRNAPQP